MKILLVRLIEKRNKNLYVEVKQVSSAGRSFYFILLCFSTGRIGIKTITAITRVTLYIETA